MFNDHIYVHNAQALGKLTVYHLKNVIVFTSIVFLILYVNNVVSGACFCLFVCLFFTFSIHQVNFVFSSSHCLTTYKFYIQSTVSGVGYDIFP